MIMLQSYGAICPPTTPIYVLDVQPIVSALYVIVGMLIGALALSTAAIALPLLAINRKLTTLIRVLKA
jgi:hypothetical protein